MENQEESIKKYAILSLDIIIENEKGEILLLKRDVDPEQGKKVLPGGHMFVTDDNIESAVKRSLHERAGLEVEIEKLVGVYADPNKKVDPRFYSVQVLYKAKLVQNKKDAIYKKYKDSFYWLKPRYLNFTRLGFNHKFLIKDYLQKKKNNNLEKIKRSFFSDYFGKDFEYMRNDNYVHIVGKAIILNEKNEILLAHRIQEPFKGSWDLPGGHMYVDESLENCVVREVREELGVGSEVKELFQIYSDKGANPKFSRAMFLFFVDIKNHSFTKNIEMDDFGFFPLDKLPEKISYHNECALDDIKRYLTKSKV